jgi:hypothetical protein
VGCVILETHKESPGTKSVNVGGDGDGLSKDTLMQPGLGLQKDDVYFTNSDSLGLNSCDTEGKLTPMKADNESLITPEAPAPKQAEGEGCIGGLCG